MTKLEFVFKACDYAFLTCPPLVYSSSYTEQSSAVEQTVGFCTACLSTFSNCYCRASRMRNTTCRCADSCSTWASRLWLNGEAERRNGGGRGEEFTTSCSWGGRAWSLHAWINPIKSALALYSPAPSLPPPRRPFLSVLLTHPLFSYIPLPTIV